MERMRVASYLIIIFFAPMILFLNFHLLVFNGKFYKSEFGKLNVYEQFSSKEEVETQSQNLIKYLCCSGKLEGDFFTEREKLHLIDVKNLIRLSTIQFVLTLVITAVCMLFLAFKKKIQLMAFSLKWGALVTILAIVFLWASSFINIPKFEKSFVTFHEIAFDNDLWQMPPEANLIKLFPAQFFVDFANRIAFQSVGMAIFIFLASRLMIRGHLVAKRR